MHGRFRVSATPAHRPPVSPSNGLYTPTTPLSAPFGNLSHLSTSNSVDPFTPLVTHLSYHTPSNLGQKRRRNSDKENELPDLSHLSTRSPPESTMNSKKRKRYTPRKTPAEKLEAVFSAIEEAKWGLGDFLYHVFGLKDEDGEKIQRSKRHAGMVQRFLQGNARHTPATIIDAWFRNPDGCISSGSAEQRLMYSTDIPYTEIQSIRPALTSFAVQLVTKRLVKEAQEAVHPSNGLHATMKKGAGKE